MLDEALYALGCIIEIAKNHPRTQQEDSLAKLLILSPALRPRHFREQHPHPWTTWQRWPTSAAAHTAPETLTDRIDRLRRCQNAAAHEVLTNPAWAAVLDRFSAQLTALERAMPATRQPA